MWLEPDAPLVQWSGLSSSSQQRASSCISPPGFGKEDGNPWSGVAKHSMENGEEWAAIDNILDAQVHGSGGSLDGNGSPREGEASVVSRIRDTLADCVLESCGVPKSEAAVVLEYSGGSNDATVQATMAVLGSGPWSDAAEQLRPISSAGGVRNKKYVPREPVYFRYVFTLWHQCGDDVSEAGQVYQGLLRMCDEFIYQEEMAPTTKRLHLQGRVKLKQKMSRNSFCAILRDHGVIRPIHVEPEFKEKESELYCCKEESRVRGPWAWPPRYVGQDIISADQLMGWQKKLLAYLQGPVHKREILWIVDALGCTGKSAFVKYVAFHLKGAVYGWVKATNLLYQVASGSNHINF